MATKKKPAAPEGNGPDRTNDESDVEGHTFINPTTARELARYREMEIQRANRERQLAKEARPNKNDR